MSHTVVANPIDSVVTTPSNLEAEVIAGYELQKLIGTGGYGEVWRATGPGGLQKAVKILFGRHDGPLADSELKSLERVRELRHPFLLSLERIEIINGRLVIVTELAEGSLEDRFTACVRDGAKGIPREELLAYLRDAADALDFMSEVHGLQHLDIKPGNLLIQGGRLKVADFGLSKDLRQAVQSLVAGFTPLFAPPELLSGAPSTASDQYSLAIVYQMLLTGTPPFSGRTTSQLAAQHLRSTPDLSALMPADRSIVGRALSKNPRGRFRNCRQFVDQLGVAGPAARPEPPQREAAPRPQPGAAAAKPALERSTRAAPAGVAARPPVILRDGKTRFRPTVFVGIGGLATCTLHALQQRLHSRFGDQAELPAWQFLYVDSDSQSLAAIRFERGTAAAQSAEYVSISLRTAGEYRSDSRRLLEWLGRRWLFNIPRSGQVAGMRPLGRLAFVDHCDEFREKLRQALEAATRPEELAAMAQATGLQLDSGPPDVVIVAGVSGGTGSGAVLDAAYIAREIMGDLGYAAGSLLGLLIHATAGRDNARDVQRANSIACLHELRHFETGGLGYPGDPACRLPRCGTGPFTETYFVPFGDILAEEALEQRTLELAEYLYWNAATPARAFLTACRGGEGGEPAAALSGPRLRTFGVATPNPRQLEAVAEPADRLCLELLQAWQVFAPPSGAAGEALPDVAGPAGVWADKLVTELQLATEPLMQRATGLLRGELGRKVTAGLGPWMMHLFRHQEQAHSPAGLMRALDEEFRDTPSPESKEPLQRLFIAIQTEFDSRSRQPWETLHERLLAYIDETPGRLAAGKAALAAVVRHLDRIDRELTARVATFEDDRLQLAISLGAPEKATGQISQNVLAELQQYFILKLCGVLHARLIDCVRGVRHALHETSAAFTGLEQRLAALAQQLDSNLGTRPAAAPALPEGLAAKWDESLRAHRRVSLSSLAQPGENRLEEFAASLRRQAREFLLAKTADAASDANVPRPALFDLASGCRVMASSPERSEADSWKQKLESVFGRCVTALHNPDDRRFLCCEADGLEPGAVVEHLAVGDERILEMAKRLHTRTDVAW